MPEIYSELTAPTQVTHSAVLSFTSASAQNLAVAKTSLLQVFTTVTRETLLSPGDSSSDAEAGPGIDRRIQDAGADDEQGEFAADLALQRGGLENTTKLVLVAEYPLYGFVVGLQRVKTIESRSGGETLLVSFAEAKMSLLEWDPETASISTVSLHSYERDEFLSPVVSEGLPSTLIADPESRCAALKFAGDMLAILPFRRKEDEDLTMGDGDVGMEDAGDAVMLDGETDDWDPAAPEPVKPAAVKTNGNISSNAEKERHDSVLNRPYNSSFVVSAAQLDDQIEHIVSLTFLHEYREPTFGILYCPRRTWTGLLAADGRRDTCSYIVITLDLEQKASTPILSVSRLPYDIFKVVALAPPIGGSLLVGGNELIHVDQAGKTTGVAVNTYTKRSTGFPALADQSDLALALEGCALVELEGESGDLLLITKDGMGLIVSFKMDGRNVSGINIAKMAHHQSALVGGRATTAVSLGGRRVFIGCSQGDARILKWRRRAEKKQVAAAAGLGLDEEALENVDMEDVYNMMDEFEEDDLYGSSTADNTQRKDSIFPSGRRGSTGRNKGEYVFSTHDRLTNLGPLRDLTFGRPTVPAGSEARQQGVMPELEIITATGPTNTSEDAGLAIMRRSIGPTIVGKFDFEACQALWTVRARSSGEAGEEQLYNADSAFDRYLFVSKAEESQVFRVGDTFEEVHGTDFDAEGGTIEVGVVGEEQRIAQVVKEFVRVYDCDLNLSQIIPMFDEDTGEEGPPIEWARICDPYVVLLREDKSVVVHRLVKRIMELEAVDMGAAKETKYTSASVYEARPGTISLGDGNLDVRDHLLALLTTDGALQIFNLKNMKAPLFVAEHFDALPVLVTGKPPAAVSSGPGRASACTEDIVEIVLADLGDTVARDPYLIVRSSRNDITIYKLFLSPSTSSIRFAKIPQPIVPGTGDSPPPPYRPMTVLPNVAGYASVFLPGASPSLILKTPRSLPRLYPLCGPTVRSLSPFHTSSADRGFVYVDAAGVVRVGLLPQGFTYEQAWSTRKVRLPEAVRAVSYYPPMDVYVVSAVSQNPFGLEEDDGSLAMGDDDQQLHPTVEGGSLAVVNPVTWTIVDRHPFAYNETALVVDTLSLEVSEHSKARAPMLCAGTAILKGEDHSARGAVYVFEVIEVVPEVGRPETNRKLKLVAREEVKGVVSALTGVNGYILAAQGQKIMVRGLKEDQSLLPVAFMDVGAWVQSVKTLGGMVLGGEDGGRGVWFAGFSEEPYKMTLFGKDTQPIECVAADFLPDGPLLFFAVADAEGNLHILQYDPEHPKSLHGQRLLRRAAFHIGHEITSMTRLPCAAAPAAGTSDTPSEDLGYLLLLTTRTGMLATVQVLPETTYRRLNILAGQIINAEEHAAGLNPRAYRAVPDAGGVSVAGEVLRGVLDGAVVGRWIDLARGRGKEVAEKSRGDVNGMRADWASLGGAALAYM